MTEEEFQAYPETWLKKWLCVHHKQKPEICYHAMNCICRIEDNVCKEQTDKLQREMI